MNGLPGPRLRMRGEHFVGENGGNGEHKCLPRNKTPRNYNIFI